MKAFNTYLIAGLSAMAVVVTSCNETPVETPESDKRQINKELNDPNRAFNTTFDGKLFSIPSPIQTAMLIKDAKVDYNVDLLNGEDNISKYSTPEKKALNLGIYGADLGYATLYEQNSKSITYLNVIESLSNDLNIAGAFDKEFLERFEANATNQDSMLVILSDAFKKGDIFLKENDRKATSVLILTGGWIESMFFAGELYKSSKNEKVLTRVGEQKQTLETIIDVLLDYNKDGVNDKLIGLLQQLEARYRGVKLIYSYVAPETSEADKLTTIKSRTIVEMDEETTNLIIEQIEKIRAYVTE